MKNDPAGFEGNRSVIACGREEVEEAHARAREALLGMRNERGFWEGELSTSALSTATAVVALDCVNGGGEHGEWIAGGCAWLVRNQNGDGGWGDTVKSFSNISTTLLCWSALRKCLGAPASPPAPADGKALGAPSPSLASADDRELESAGEKEKEKDKEKENRKKEFTLAITRAEDWIRDYVGSLEPGRIAEVVKARYGKDRTFSVPILMLCAICGTLGPRGWRYVLPLPLELAAFPRGWFAVLRLPVVSYALPALIAIGRARFVQRPPLLVNPLRWIRRLAWPRISRLLAGIQPSSGGFLEAAPLTSFVTMALAAAGEEEHPVVPKAVDFLRESVRPDGSWPIDTNLSTWATTLSVKALATAPDASGEGKGGSFSAWDRDLARAVRTWLLGQQYRGVHPFTDSPPGGWAWTDLPGGVPDADDTPGALLALRRVAGGEAAFADCRKAALAGIRWLLDLQNRDGGIPTFCRGWGALPFDRSSPDLTAHALRAWAEWRPFCPDGLRGEIGDAMERALAFLRRRQNPDGSWTPLWFGNQHRRRDEANPTYGTSQVLVALRETGTAVGAADRGEAWLLRNQNADGGWGGGKGTPSSIEETALAVSALVAGSGREKETAREKEKGRAARAGVAWLVETTGGGRDFPASPVGFYFAKLWYFEKIYPLVWTVEALGKFLDIKDN